MAHVSQGAYWGFASVIVCSCLNDMSANSVVASNLHHGSCRVSKREVPSHGAKVAGCTLGALLNENIHGISTAFPQTHSCRPLC